VARRTWRHDAGYPGSRSRRNQKGGTPGSSISWRATTNNAHRRRYPFNPSPRGRVSAATSVSADETATYCVTQGVDGLMVTASEQPFPKHQPSCRSTGVTVRSRRWTTGNCEWEPVRAKHSRIPGFVACCDRKVPRRPGDWCTRCVESEHARVKAGFRGRRIAREGCIQLAGRCRRC